MANTRELRRRIRSVKNTAQITKAMEMVSATKMRRAQGQAVSGRPYSSTLSSSLGKLTGKISPEMNRLLQANNSPKVGVVLLTTDKSLCGALNTNVFRRVMEFTKEKNNLTFYTVGTKGRSFVVKTGKDLEADFDNSDIVEYRKAKQIAKLVLDAFLKEELGEVYLIFPNFISTLRQEPAEIKLLPIDAEVINASFLHPELDMGSDTKPKTPRSQSERGTPSATQPLPPTSSTDYLIEPDPNTLLDFVLTHQVETQIYQALLETKASEHSARMIAMQNATNNARDLVDDLNLTYNQTRQDAITKELLEITTASAALE
jgi:F-type H+-transporting ATPase subunit gamma